ncbi:MAG: hypothetical protein COZ06_19595 [Armatimonadetes bacterium CG_4_10_14_3_um_filter_66_18]|nr:MAG: hypothetical protein AUJ96_27135 [Armatimonadetes bacterium CG2_30_66_41]PIU89125.1 MAG: hypothetical protein COS65_29040 [Armatimonadetes bacterium CG06_land_8_20_14_3_00_66_21]PIX42757.1 MAG: hypothetical protein COZ57_20705 [Armatimonadetes bacterium CG_4_8_14_3_um_filter_66_20]PIY44870.1 MAG: hypothetical protein COZ06_19595 [Armatimonadetes bacterium CG_4_10_14_3_um_filter_66_18]PIZ41647.1 MAG: hypothetical protein COY42_18895 [Armatimonadetes bacterium CG_4_10_14_0_8_um_filter_66_
MNSFIPCGVLRIALWTGVAVLVVAASATAEDGGPTTLAASAYGGSLKTALAALGDAPGTLLVDGTLECDAPAVPANVDLVVPRGGRLALGATPLKVEGTLSAGRYEIFSPTGTVTGLKDPCPEWFGAGGLGTTDDTAAVQRAIDSIGDRLGSRLLLGGKYAVTSLLVTHFGFMIQSENAWLVARPGKADYLLRFTPSAPETSSTFATSPLTGGRWATPRGSTTPTAARLPMRSCARTPWSPTPTWTPARRRRG